MRGSPISERAYERHAIAVAFSETFLIAGECLYLLLRVYGDDLIAK